MSELKPCQHIRDDHVVPGWCCCNCHAYNGYQREQCRICGHSPCYETRSNEGKEALELRPIGHDRKKVIAWLAAKNAQGTQYTDNKDKVS